MIYQKNFKTLSKNFNEVILCKQKEDSRNSETLINTTFS